MFFKSKEIESVVEEMALIEMKKKKTKRDKERYAELKKIIGL